MNKTIALRLKENELAKLDHLVRTTGFNQSEVIRRLIDAATIMPAMVRTEIEVANGTPAPTKSP